jgi:hypothetical protein
MVNRAGTAPAAPLPPEIPRDEFEAAYNMVNPCVFRQGRSLCSLKREIQTLRAASAAADEVAALRGGTRTRVAQTTGMKDKTGGSMWAPF